jgi:hypothetical protein
LTLAIIIQPGIVLIAASDNSKLADRETNKSAISVQAYQDAARCLSLEA